MFLTGDHDLALLFTTVSKTSHVLSNLSLARSSLPEAKFVTSSKTFVLVYLYIFLIFHGCLRGFDVKTNFEQPMLFTDRYQVGLNGLTQIN